ncbi:ubiquitin-like protein 7 isoform X2 [Antedon mediterranea]|uniref:ubiquitin-like protein 7 isoform X2 n=1 Tax=Antedon mediterranea TaxID=105859 RepID=UPI003AF5EA63
MSTLNLKFIEKRFRERLNGVDILGDVRVVREDVVKLLKLPSTAFDIIYAGQVLQDGKSLESYGMKPGVTLHAVSKREPEQEIKPEPFDDKAINQLLTALHAALINPVHRHAVYTILNNPDTLKNIAATTPGLTSDHVAMAFLRDADLIIQISDPDNLKKIVEKHPAIGHAALQIAASSVSETNSRLGAVLSGQEPGFMSDEEMDTSDGAAASTSTGATTQNTTSSSSGLQPITVDMFTQAMAHALQASASASVSSSPANTSRSNGQLKAEDLKEQMQTLRDMGFPNDDQNLRALQASNGIVQGALDLIISQRVL